MEWYKIVIGIVAYIVGLFIYSKYKDFHKNKYHNDSWKSCKK